MKRVLAASAVAGAVLMGSAMPSMAAATAVPTFFVGDQGASAPIFAPSGMFDYTFTFTTTMMSMISAAVQNTGKTVSFLTLTLTPDSMGSFPTSITSNSNSTQIAGESTAFLPASTYTVEVTGVGNAASNALNATFSLTNVPLPGTLAMFGLALAGLGVAGAVTRKGKTAPTAAA